MEKINVSLTSGAILFPSMAYCATFEGYDGAPDAGFQPMGFGATEAEAIADLKDQQAEYEAEMWEEIDLEKYGSS